MINCVTVAFPPVLPGVSCTVSLLIVIALPLPRGRVIGLMYTPLLLLYFPELARVRCEAT